MDVVENARQVLTAEAEALTALSKDVGNQFKQIISLLSECQGKVVITGMGKSGHIGRKIAATMSSLGTPSFFLHPGEAMHGDLGMVQQQDIVIAISYSGESDEILRILPSIKSIGASVIGFTCNGESSLAKNCKAVQVFSGIREACHLGLAPTTSTTIMMAYGDAVAVVLSEKKGFGRREFGLFHPAGSLGKKLTNRVADLMQYLHNDELVGMNTTIKSVILAFSKSGADIAVVVNDKKQPIGFLTDGMLTRMLEDEMDIYHVLVKEVYNQDSIFIDKEAMAIEALEIMIDQGITAMPVVNEGRAIGIISKKKILETGIYL